MSGQSTRIRRWVGAAVTAGVIAGGSIAIGTFLTPSSSSGASGGGHHCDLWGVPDDDGLVTDVVHHAVEPLVPSLHGTNCTLQGPLQLLGCNVPGLGALRGYQAPGWECIQQSL